MTMHATEAPARCRRFNRAQRLVGALAAAFAALAIVPAMAGAAAWRPSVAVPGPADRIAGFDVAAGPDGTVVAVWTKTTDGKSQVMQSVRPPGGQFAPPAPLGAPGGGSPQVAVDGDGDATVVWEQRVGDTVTLTIEQSTRPAGGTFGVAEPLSSFSDESRTPDIAMNSRGDTIVTWTNSTTSERIEAAARPAGGSFGSRVPVSGATGTTAAFNPQAAVGENGSGIVAWERDDGLLQAAPWSAAVNGFGSRLDVTAGAAAGEFGAEPDVAVLPDGRSLIAYFGTVSGANPAIKAKTLANGVLSGATNIAALPTFSGSPSLVSDPAGDVLAAWDSGSSTMRAAFRPAGQGFQPAQTLSVAASSPKGFSPPATALTPRGDAVVAWLAGPDGSERVQARTKPRGGGFSALRDDFPAHTDIQGVVAFADGEGNMGTLQRYTGAGQPGKLELRPFDAAPPRPAGLSLPSGAVERRSGGFSAAFVDTWSPFSLSWRFGDGATGSGNPVNHAYGAPGTFVAAASALDAAGNAAVQSGTVGVRALRPDEIDADGDGFRSNNDCDDGNRSIRPGAIEIRGNAVDENCDRVIEPFPRIAATASLVTLFGRDFTQLEALKIRDLESGDLVKLSCRGRGCVRSLNATIRVTRKTRILTLTKRVRGVRLRKRARLQVRVAHPGFVARLFRFTVKRFGAVPVKTELCQPPGAARPGRC
jgi:hypothetical protein